MEELGRGRRRIRPTTEAATAPLEHNNMSNRCKPKLKKMMTDLTTTTQATFATATNRTMSNGSCKRLPSSPLLLPPASSSLLSPFSSSSFFKLVMCLLLLLCGFLIGQLEAIKLQPEGANKFYWSGEQFVITCQNNNNIKNVKIRWIGPNGLDITDDRSQRVHAQSSGPHGHRLVVMNATADVDDGQYKCTLGSTDDRSPREHIEFQLKLFKTTRFLDTPTHSVLPVGQTGTLSCKVEFDPNVLSASVSWVRDQKPIEMFNDSDYKVSEYDQPRQLSQLTISPLTKQHDGIYTCRAVAVTAQLSKISDHDIRLETHYAPSFDTNTYTVWVERSHWQTSGGGRLQAAGMQQRTGNSAAGNLYPSAGNNGAGSRQSFGVHQAGGGRLSNKHQAGSLSSMLAANGGRRGSPIPIGESHMDQASSDGSSSALMNGDSTNSSIVRVELRCSCSANPPANIFWTSQNSIYVLTKGEPSHVLEVPTMEVDGHNTTSVLTIAYNVGDPDWPNKRDIYTCSASNKLGKASKSYTIEQGDPPPAFNVGPIKQYNPQTTQFKFTLMGPNFDPESSAQGSPVRGSASQAIVPPVDSFRIRAENPLGSSEQRQTLSSSFSSSSSSPSAASAGSGSSHHWSSSSSASSLNAMRIRQQAAAELLSVQWQLDQQQQSLQDLNYQARNVTVNLGKLPSGNQKLYLEAHNAVGWSPNATYLGEYYIVSAASSISSLSPLSALLVTLSSFISFLLTAPTKFSSVFGLQRQSWQV